MSERIRSLPAKLPSTIELIDLRSDLPGAQERRALCMEFYDKVYRNAFPKPDQAETPDVWLPLINEDHPAPNPILHLILARKCGLVADGSGGAVVGGILIEYYRQSRAALATYLAVAPLHRRSGVGGRLLASAIERVSTDNGGICPLVLAEVERPEAQRGEADRRSARARVSIIAALGGRQLQFRYIQPRLGAGQRPVEDLMLVLLAPRDSPQDGVPRATVESFLDEFFRSLGQRGSTEFQRVQNSLPPDRIPLRKLRET